MIGIAYNSSAVREEAKFAFHHSALDIAILYNLVRASAIAVA